MLFLSVSNVIFFFLGSFEHGKLNSMEIYCTAWDVNKSQKITTKPERGTGENVNEKIIV